VGVADEDLYPTDVLGSGTFGGGCGLDLDRWLPASCEVELRVEGLGSLRSSVQKA
jgi:2-keto-4-pentenoate hydratase/2-oxohepta-3-ene-1,7-dioic acid hydratase in catechol pathway